MITPQHYKPNHSFKAIDRQKLQSLVFLLIWPLINLLMTTTILIDLNMFQWHFVVIIAIRVWAVFGLGFLLIKLLQWRVPTLKNTECFFCQLTLHCIVIIGTGIGISPYFEPPAFLENPPSMILPRFVVFLEITIYLIFLRVLDQQEHAFTTSMVLKESELNALRSQSNPHFLFNTLNLIAAEISDSPDNAKEIVFDLADLLRSNVKLAQQRSVSLKEELRLVRLYLSLQQKRFKERLSFDIAMAVDTQHIEVPALLLLPVVENTVKHAVAPYATKAHIKIETVLLKNKLIIIFRDTGPEFDDTDIVEGNGFRILREMLSLQYRDSFDLYLRSTKDGGELTIVLPKLANPK